MVEKLITAIVNGEEKKMLTISFLESGKQVASLFLNDAGQALVPVWQRDVSPYKIEASKSLQLPDDLAKKVIAFLEAQDQLKEYFALLEHLLK